MKNQKIGILLQARCGSSRFPRKVLEPLNGEPLLEIQLKRLRRCTLVQSITVVTTGSPMDDAIATLCTRLSTPYYRGSELDVLDRYYRAAIENRLDVIVRLTSDCPLIDPAIVDEGISQFQSGSYDYAANTVPPPSTFPDGMDVEIFSMNALRIAWGEAVKPSEREHVTFFLWKQPNRFRMHKFNAPQDASNCRLTVDYPEDLKTIEDILYHLNAQGKFGNLAEILSIVAATPGLGKSRHYTGEGWNPALIKDIQVDEKFTLKSKASSLQHEQTEAAWVKAMIHIPGGSQTFSKGPDQFVRGVAPKMLQRGRGSKVWDLDGNEYIDYVLGLGPAILGHSHPEINQAATDVANDFFVSPSLPHPMETHLAEKLSNLIPCAEMVKFGKNGSDVTAGAVRLARAVTKRDIVACAGYHGWHDWFIGSTMRRAGVPESVRKLTRTFEYNSIESLEKIFKEHPHQVACVILEPVTFVLPENDFLLGVRELCTRYGALLIFDEIITGFRLDMHGAQGYFGVTPDLATFGKAVANGYPLAILCGKEIYMREFKNVFFSFTFGGELPSIGAALKTLEILERDHTIEHIAKQGYALRAGMETISREMDMPCFKALGLDFWPEFDFQPQINADRIDLMSLFQQEIVRRGILTRPALFISGAHSPYDIQATLCAIRDALSVVKHALEKGLVREWLDGHRIEPVFRFEKPT